MPLPWTQSLTLNWRAELRFYEKRYEILRHLDENASMWAFRASETLAEARLIDRWQLLSIKQNRASIHLLAPTANAEATWEALEYAVNTIRPRALKSVAVAFQYVEPLDLELDEAIERGHQRILTHLAVDGLHLGDWAVLVDLQLDGVSGGEGQTEFGIVTPGEVPERFSRDSGRTTFAEPAPESPRLWADVTFPAVALFADISFTAPLGAEDKGLVATRTFWETARERAGNLVDVLKTTLVSADTNEEVAS